MTGSFQLDRDDRPAEFALAIHGGAGTIDDTVMSDAERSAHHAALRAALYAGRQCLADGACAVAAVEAVVIALEDCALFNAGHGACLSFAGRHELDAAIMDGTTLNCGAVAGVQQVRNPVRAARAVMDHSPHVLLAGAGADAFATAEGLAPVDNAYFTTELRRQQWQTVRNHQADDAADMFRFGTVGAVARDSFGGLAAATSTGGVTAKRWGRIGDSPLIGAGTRADATCAISCTGAGERFIQHGVAHEISARMRLAGQTLADATAELLGGVLASPNGSGGLIGVDADGRIVLGSNTRGMYRGWTRSDSPAMTTAISREHREHRK
ncbi:isoaspartyl peptidase/L-asparaginase [Salinisphaera sp. SPP-AMP-43]|uniref:isoaspartyl peptidase/L-asparaginase family protein n=1 Tax=Salinisphaera sp. SPP-AMP-43 TaxID=3121288 RepID=UPI003C6DBB2C